MRMLGFRKLCFLGSGFLLTLLCGLQAAFGQTSADLSTKYRQVVSYLLRPTVIMTPRFAVDGQVCEMAIERRQNTDTEIVIATSFSEEEVHELVDELAPEAERGRNLTRHLNGFVAGGSIITQYSYENLLVQVYGTTRPEPTGNSVIVITWPKRTCSGGQNSKTNETVDPKKRNVHLTIPVVATNKHPRIPDR